MRTTRPLALFSATALAGATLVAGTGLAGADTGSLGSLSAGSIGSDDISFTVDHHITTVTTTTVEGTVTNNTDAQLDCWIDVHDAATVVAAEEAFDAGDDDWYPDDPLDAFTAVFPDPGETSEWEVSFPALEGDAAGALIVYCDEGVGPDLLNLFLYGPDYSTGGFLSSLDIGGSLSGSLDS